MSMARDYELTWKCERCGKDGVIPREVEPIVGYVEMTHKQVSPDCDMGRSATFVINPLPRPLGPGSAVSEYDPFRSL